MDRRTFLKILGIGAVNPIDSLLSFAEVTADFVGFSRIFDQGNHYVGICASHGNYDAEIFSAYRVSDEKELKMKVQDALDVLSTDGWKAVGNAGPLLAGSEESCEGIDPNPGEGIVFNLESRLNIMGTGEYNNLTNAADQADSVVRGHLLQYNGEEMLDHEGQGEVIPRSGIAVGDYGFVYLVFKHVDMEKFLEFITNGYNGYVGEKLGKSPDVPNVIQLASGDKASFIMDETVAGDGIKYIMSEFQSIIASPGFEVDYREFEEPEVPVVNFFAFRPR